MDNRNRVPTQPGGVTESVARTGEGTNAGANEMKVTQGEKRREKKRWTKQRKISLGVLVVGILALVGGVGFLVYNLLKTPDANDAEFLVEVGEWQREDATGVVWNFMEIGKGTLTTNGGENEYDFEWAFEDDKLKIDTDWLYTLNDEYEFELDQEAKKFTVANGDETITFVEKN